MSSLIFPPIAELALQENHILKSLSLIPKIYFRYAVDIYLFCPKNDINDLINKSYSFNSYIRITVEEKREHHLNFSDITVFYHYFSLHIKLPFFSRLLFNNDLAINKLTSSIFKSKELSRHCIDLNHNLIIQKFFTQKFFLIPVTLLNLLICKSQYKRSITNDCRWLSH